VKDYIAPQGFEFRFPGRYKMGHMFGATKYLDIISPKLNDELLKRLLDIDSNISISIHMQTIEPIEAIKLLKRALSDVQKTKIDEQKKAASAQQADDGSYRGAIASITSGKESISYAVGSAASISAYAAAAASAGAQTQLLGDIAAKYLARVPDANGVFLLYAGVMNHGEAGL
jgi:hypothetical protein